MDRRALAECPNGTLIESQQDQEVKGIQLTILVESTHTWSWRLRGEFDSSARDTRTWTMRRLIFPELGFR